MGGNALKQYETRRYAREEYLNLETKVVRDFWDIFGIDSKIQLVGRIPYYWDKESFGDMDLIINSDVLPVDWVDRIVDFYDLSNEQWSKNGNVLSFGIENFQIDLIATQGKYFESSRNYF